MRNRPTQQRRAIRANADLELQALVLQMLEDGEKQVYISAVTGLSQQWISDLKQRYLREA